MNSAFADEINLYPWPMALDIHRCKQYPSLVLPVMWSNTIIGSNTEK